MKLTTTKAEAIRSVTRENMGLTNVQIREMVWQRYHLRVDSNQIINLVGPFRERIVLAGYSSELLNKASEYCRAVGDFRLAKVLLEMVRP